MDALSTINPASLEAYRSIPWARSSADVATVVEVKTDSLNSVLARHAIPHNFDLMIIDVEGSEEPIVVSLLGSPWRPKVLVVELCDIHPDFSSEIELQTSHKRIRQSIIASGYREFYSDPVNSIFYRP
jgi:hypothetical protein